MAEVWHAQSQAMPFQRLIVASFHMQSLSSSEQHEILKKGIGCPFVEAQLRADDGPSAKLDRLGLLCRQSLVGTCSPSALEINLEASAALSSAFIHWIAVRAHEDGPETWPTQKPLIQLSPLSVPQTREGHQRICLQYAAAYYLSSSLRQCPSGKHNSAGSLAETWGSKLTSAADSVPRCAYPTGNLNVCTSKRHNPLALERQMMTITMIVMC